MRDLFRLAACLLCAAVILSGCGRLSASSGKDGSAASRTEDDSETERSSRSRQSSSSAEGSEGSSLQETGSAREETPDSGKTDPGGKTAEPEETAAVTEEPASAAPEGGSPAETEGTPAPVLPDVYENAFFRVAMPAPWQGKAVFRAVDDRTVSIDCGTVPLAVIGVDAAEDSLRGDVYIAWSAPFSSGEDIYIQASSVFYALVFDEMAEAERKEILLLATGGAYASDSVGFEDADRLFEALTPYYAQILVPGIVIKAPEEGETPAEEAPAPSAETAFYGIWCLSSRDRADAQRMADTLTAAGLPAEVIDTGEWDGLNDGWYSVTAGRFPTKEDADAALASVKAVAGDAYVKYSGEPKR